MNQMNIFAASVASERLNGEAAASNDFGASELAERLADYSLVRYDFQASTVGLHDVIRQYLSEQLSDAPVVHARLIDAWGNLLDLPDDYSWRFVVYHLIESDDWQRLEIILTDLRFIEAKCKQGMTFDLNRDYNNVLDALPERQPEREKEPRRPLSNHGRHRACCHHEEGLARKASLKSAMSVVSITAARWE